MDALVGPRTDDLVQEIVKDPNRYVAETRRLSVRTNGSAGRCIKRSPSTGTVTVRTRKSKYQTLNGGTPSRACRCADKGGCRAQPAGRDHGGHDTGPGRGEEQLHCTHAADRGDVARRLLPIPTSTEGGDQVSTQRLNRSLQRRAL